MRIVYILFLSAAAVFFACSATAQQTEKRIALVVGNAAYQAEALTTAANDAGLIAQTLQAAGFDVVGARDLDQDALRRSFRDFLDKATGSGSDTVAFIYFAGYGVQLEGENYLVPIDARIARDKQQQQRQQQVEQQRQLQQQRQQQVEQQRQQQIQQQRQASPQGPAKKPPCGGQGQPPCPR
jgi:hypothetical protein